jgi:hypothetical protein
MTNRCNANSDKDNLNIERHGCSTLGPANPARDDVEANASKRRHQRQKMTRRKAAFRVAS